MSILFRAKFRDELCKAGLLENVGPAVWKRDWVVHSKAVGDGRTSLKYLATYVFRVGISDHHIVACEDHKVTFSHRKSGTNRCLRMSLDAMELIWRFLQHVLPSGFQKVRHYGFLGAHAPLSIEAVRSLVMLKNGEQFLLRAATPADAPLRPARRYARRYARRDARHDATPDTTLRPTRRCAECGGQLCVIAIVPKPASSIHDTS